MAQLDNTFVSYACDILADTETGLSGSNIVQKCKAYAIDFDKSIPHGSYPFDAPNKRTAMYENLLAFEDKEQYRIIKEIASLPIFANNVNAQALLQKLFRRYGYIEERSLLETELIDNTKHWLSAYPEAMKSYESALLKYDSKVFERNILDDMRLSFESLVKGILGNEKSLENQIVALGQMLKGKEASPELCNMAQKLIKYYTDYQNTHVKHNDRINSNEIEFIIELTSVFMKYLLKISK